MLKCPKTSKKEKCKIKVIRIIKKEEGKKKRIFRKILIRVHHSNTQILFQCENSVQKHPHPLWHKN